MVRPGKVRQVRRGGDGKVRHGTVGLGMAGMVRSGLDRYGLVRLGELRCGPVWQARHGMAWRGEVW